MILFTFIGLKILVQFLLNNVLLSFVNLCFVKYTCIGVQKTIDTEVIRVKCELILVL